MTHHGVLHQVQEHMKVVGSDGEDVGMVDHLDGDRIKLTRDGSGQHHYVTGDSIDAVREGQVRLSIPAAQAKRQWQADGLDHAMNPAMNPSLTGATVAQRSLLGAAEGGRGGGQRMGQTDKRQGDTPVVGGDGDADDATGGTGATRDPI